MIESNVIRYGEEFKKGMEEGKWDISKIDYNEVVYLSATKHEQIIRYIESLEVGTKVSVRQVAKELEVSEGTAYRAIKQAENIGLVNSIPKVATVRVEKPEKKQLEERFNKIMDKRTKRLLNNMEKRTKTLKKVMEKRTKGL